MSVDVVTEMVIERPPDDVAAFAGDPTNAPRWYVNIRTIEWKTQPPAAVGSQIAFVAQFLGKQLAYTYEITELIPVGAWSCAPPRGRSQWRRPTHGR